MPLDLLGCGFLEGGGEGKEGCFQILNMAVTVRG